MLSAVVSSRPRRNQRRPALRAALSFGLLALAGAAPLRAHLDAGGGVPAAPRLGAPLDTFTLGSLALAGPSFGAFSDTAWLTAGLEQKRSFRLAPPPTLALLGRYLRPWENHTPDWRAFREGAYGLPPAPSLTWRLTEAPEPAELPVLESRPCPRWLLPRALTVVRYA